MEFDVLSHIANLMSFELLVLLFIGTVLGIVIGVLPGMGPTVACAVILPFTIGMEPLYAISLLVAIYCSGIYAGSLSAILINTPGTPSAVATCLDGFPLAQKGQADRAIGVGTIASATGGMISVVVFILAAPLLAKIAYHFGPAEYFALTIFGMSMLTSIGGDALKSLISGFFGVFLATVGMDMFTGIERFTFGNDHIADGISFVPVLVGLFAISEFFAQSTALDKTVKRFDFERIKLPSKDDLKRIWRAVLRSTGIGTFIGILPAEGSTVAAIIGYNEEKRWSPNKKNFGKGAIEGVAAAESANNAATAGTMVPTLALGIPGGGTAAVILAALIMHGLRPGPQLFDEQPEFFYGIGFTMLLSNILFLILGLLFARYFARVTLIPNALLWPSVFAISVVGVYAFHQSIYDVGTMLLFGIIGFFIRRYGFSSIALAIGLLLGEMLENTLRQSLVIFDGNGWLFFSSPIAGLFFVLSAMAIGYPYIKNRKSK